MLLSLNDPLIQSAFGQAAKSTTRAVKVGAKSRKITTPFPSPQDWRDVWIYFLMLDRFNRAGLPACPMTNPSASSRAGRSTVRDKLKYIKDLPGRSGCHPC